MPSWQVVGGADKGGILVRQGQDLKSPAEESRLSTGAIVEQLELVGDRLHYKVKSGTGPETGWVSVKLTGKDLLVPYEEPLAPVDPADWPTRLQAALSSPPAEGGTLKDSAPWMGSVGKAPPKAKVRLVIFNWTGNRGGAGSAHNFAKWPKMLAEISPPETWQVCEVRYPGRSSRMKEPNATAASEIANAAVDAIKKAGPPLPTVLFGFSFGAVIAYETAALLSTKGPAPPLGLVVASAEHPAWEWRKWGVGPEGGATASTSDEAFEAVLKEKGGTDVILNSPDMKKMYLPVIRSDMIMEEAYGVTPPQHEKLACPIVVFRGKEDPIIARESTEPWLGFTACGEGTPTRVEELSTGLAPIPQSPWLCDWYLCQGDQSVDAMVKAIARDFGGAA